MILVLVVDDIPAMAEQYAYDLKRLGGFDTMAATGGSEALDIMGREPVDCVILDLEMPGVTGFDVLGKMREMEMTIPVIVYTGTGNYDRCVQAMRLGAYSFIDKAEAMERVVWEIEKGLEHAKLEREVSQLRHEQTPGTTMFGASQAMASLRSRIEKVATIPSAVLITGESGTGKELVAKYIHDMGVGGEKPFVAVNSAAFPENLIESELFGHERGAFTGANKVHRGAFERAAGGTLFLDEIGELPMPAQAKLLRVLEQRQVTRIGGERTIAVDAKVVTATNRDLEVEVEAGRFRQDLYFRLNVHILNVPPLRERLSDIPELTGFFVRSTCARFGRREMKVAPEVIESLMDHEWKRNNVRELKNIIERMVIASDGDSIEIEHIPAEVLHGGLSGSHAASDAGIASVGSPAEGPAGRGAARASFQELKAEAERRILVTALERNEWHISNTARELGLSDHSSLLKIMKRHGLKKK
ncbi:MAG: sigma-54 dependent transcriptional regulator [Bacteroidales bacterium]|nr:sigma-54 dependent transcriptional regulator [Candidatus Latescibacterota bacterium]